MRTPRPSPARLVGLVAAAALLALAAAPALRPEKPDLPPERLRELATHVIVGEVAAVYTRAEEAGGWRTTHHLAEVRVERVEKGDDLVAGELAYVRYWTRRWTGWGTPPADTNGHRGAPREGQRLRIYLARNAYDGFGRDNEDGGLNVIGANGFEALADGDEDADDDHPRGSADR